MKMRIGLGNWGAGLGARSSFCSGSIKNKVINLV